MKQDENQSELARVQLREAGLRATAARIAILKLLGELANPSTHSEISERVQPLGFDKSTIFRTLNDLATAGLARRMELGDHVWRYELATPDHDQPHTGQVHPHLLCVDCGSVTCLADEDVQVQVAKSVGAIEDILLKGHCTSCSVVK
jgi:Fur family ferric uptake transcriptional regulator